MSENTMEDQIREQAVSDAVERLLGKSYDANRLTRAIEAEVAEKIGDKWLAENEFELLKGIDTDAVIRLATLYMIKKITERL